MKLTGVVRNNRPAREQRRDHRKTQLDPEKFRCYTNEAANAAAVRRSRVRVRHQRSERPGAHVSSGTGVTGRTRRCRPGRPGAVEHPRNHRRRSCSLDFIIVQFVLFVCQCLHKFSAWSQPLAVQWRHLPGSMWAGGPCYNPFGGVSFLGIFIN